MEEQMENQNTIGKEIDPGMLRMISEFPEHGIFLTGIENSDPMVGNIRRNQLKEAYDFYTNHQSRLDNIHKLGIRWLRFGMPYSQIHLSENEYDFSLSDEVYESCNRLSINIIADLLHFGLPEWIHETDPERKYFQNPDFPEIFARYAREFSRRYPKIRFFTLVNEPYVTAFFSAKIGIWNEQIRSSWHDDKAFVIAASNIARAVILAKKAIEEVWKEENRPLEPIFVQTESFEMAQSDIELRRAEVDRFNIRRYTILDLILGLRDHKMKDFLIGQDMPEEDYEWFMQHGNTRNMMIGVDHYTTCVHIFEEKVIIDCTPLHEYQLYDLIIEYWNRYKIPMLHTETNSVRKTAIEICMKTYDVINRLRTQGYPVLGMGWYGDEYQVGWHHLLVGPRSYEEHNIGLFYKGRAEPVSEVYCRLIAKGFEPIAWDKRK